MSKFIALLLIALTTVSFGKYRDSENIELLSSGKWYLQYVVIEGQKLEFADEVRQKSWLLFNTNGTGEFSMQGRSAKGTWKYNETDNILSIGIQNEEKEYKLISLTENKLELLELGEEESTSGWSK